MRFGVLGPLAVWTSDGRPVRIPEVKVRALLAELVVEAGRVVPADRLIDHLWGENLPSNPAGALQSRVSQLRRALDDAEPSARGLVVSRAPGYLLDAEPDAVDIGRFQGLLARTRTAASPQERAMLLGDALALWRGPALIDFADEEFAGPEITRLEELRLTALEEQAEARLDLREHGQLADELGDLVARHPLRERLRAAHLRALYRAGRQNEALDGYRDLRERLADELGVDPGPELAALHQAILRQDPSLGAPPAEAPPSNLPAPLSDLIGRSDAVGQVGALLGAGRLVTLTGAGGVGKTRLAVEAARGLGAAYPDGVWLVELGSLPATAGRDEVADHVAATLRIRDEGTVPVGTPADSLAEALAAQRLLLVLDNCEHVIGSASALAAALLRAVPGLRVLATSQRPLGVAGELLWSVPPLTEADAVRLFAERARAGAPGFALDAGNAEAVAAICRRLDGIPLAVELAATRVRALGVHELAARLDDRFRLLAAGYGDAPARQRTLRAVIDWSWELLDPEERTVLRRLAVHVDGCTLRAAEAVCGEDGLDVLDLLAGLVDRSLVAVSDRDRSDGPRYRLLESVAAYCRERLREAGELDEIELRHLRHYSALAATADVHLRGPAQREWLCRLDAETANLRAALDTAVRLRNGGALPLVNSLAWYWVLRGRLSEGARSFGLALTGGGPEDAVGTAQTWRAAFQFRMGEVTAPGGSVPPATRPGDLDALAGRARAQWFLSVARLGVGDPPESEAQTGRALTLFQALGDQWGIAAALSTQARQSLLRSDLTRLREHAEESMALFGALGDRWGRLHAGFALGQYHEIVGEYEQAARLHREGLRIAEDLELWTDVADRLSSLGRIALLNGDHAQADDLHRRAMKLAAEQAYALGEEFAGLGLALSLRRQGRLDEAETLMRRWLDWNTRIGSDIALSLILAELGFVAELRGAADTARDLHLRGLDAARKSGDRRAVALALEGLAGACAVAGRHDRAARLLGTAGAIRESTGAPLPAGERGDVDRITAAARAALGPDAFAVEHEKGALQDESEVDPKSV
ncbi:BTAD domain-containing putative transcriptional regulator [Thermomonospora umbrina]|uniref:Putative ATPase n=1 Tax=Thermomonospora umbrina TaxID=111806 RepID=A0A3D9T0M0_9ACTN|nr:BTAD domain-containing putative transcriptional regulator [Thermomonospora umbrina]REE98344.1 putative ATPase [Thermomonospora umbrina]